MEITSILIILLSIAAIYTYFLFNQRYRVLFLTILSCVFIATYSYNLLLYVIIYSFINYYLGIKIYDSRIRQSLFIIGIILNLSQLILLKYVSFTINPILQILNIGFDFSIISKVIVPVGVSFFTLQGIGYLINIKMDWEKPEKNFLHFLLYISFYPRFLAGPIDRSNHFLPQLKVNQSFNEQKVIEGFRLVLVGLFKKVVIANQLAPLVSGTYANLDTADEYSLWITLLVQPLYLYFDFSGYTDIAFGFARPLGIELRPNFNRPFMSENMTEFWKRFHISLSSWFHDYVFMRTIFKYRRWGKNASTFALIVTWVLFGIWHGAGWNFMLLGLVQAIAIYYEYTTKKWRVKIFSKFPSFYRIWMGRIFTYIFFATSLVFFFAPDINSVYIFFVKLIQTDGIILGFISTEKFLLALFFIFIILSFEIFKNDFSKTYTKLESIWLSNNYLNRLIRWAFYYMIIVVIMIFNREVEQIIYFQF